ncbi:3-keto-disaccharide hydrolase [Parapedobacter sp. 10938]|uniref:3-keto-disaccharide hydrolase n=1 Tax=Parapedobacter flavus TaxID=3110225 RepID=UPI002DBF2155|nr:DUF1080 domain-containing protein [Parapedobacter sp. 10938]MEC3878536.1 DUF1080 domain-containing protein [Parapedobacter sp. 10938]
MENNRMIVNVIAKLGLTAGLCGLLALVFPAAAGIGAASDTTGRQAVALFNGKNLDGWYTFLQGRGVNKDPKRVFTVRNNQIHISGKEWGAITTNEEYENYRLVVEFRWGKKTYGTRKHRARDSGILFHCVGEDGGYKGIWMNSIECNIIEGGVGDFIVVGDGSDHFAITSPVAKERHGATPVYQKGGEWVEINGGRINWFGRDPQWKDTLGFRGAQDIDYPDGQWNEIECIVKGDTIDIYVNNVLVNQAINVRPSKGKIQIQSEGAALFIRKIELLPL